MPDAQPELSGAPLALGIYGKMPAHGDFVRRGLPSSFVTPWDAWLSAGVAAARDQLEEGFAAVWDEAPAWRFLLPAGVCGPDAVAGVMLPSEDTVGRRFPLTAAALLPPGVVAEDAWFDRLEAAVRAARQGAIDADGMIRAMDPSAAGADDAGSADVMGMLGGGMAAAPAAAMAMHAGDWRVAADPMDGPAETVASAPAGDMWGALLGDAASEPPPAADPMDGPAPAAGTQDWGALLGDGPIGPGHSAPPPAEGAIAGGGDIWGDLLGDTAPAPDPDTPTPAPTDDWDDLIGDAAAPPVEPVAQARAHPAVAGPAASIAGDAPGELPGIGAAPPATPALPPTATEDDTISPGTAAPPTSAPVRPAEGGWWTLGGARLSPMVWPLPALPPAESFILLLHNQDTHIQDPENGA